MDRNYSARVSGAVGECAMKSTSPVSPTVLSSVGVSRERLYKLLSRLTMAENSAFGPSVAAAGCGSDNPSPPDTLESVAADVAKLTDRVLEQTETILNRIGI